MPANAPTRIPSLDGWRGIAILMVLFDHITYAAAGNHYPTRLQTGGHGVTIFFVLSGFLITSNLLAEPINLKKFYIRRFFRLMPTAWAFLGTMLLIKHWTNWQEVRGCLLFYRNFQGEIGVAGHFWSLSIEEQFYLVWPSLLLLFGVKRCRWIAALGAVSIAVYRFAFWGFYASGIQRTHTEVQADALLIGCLLALLLNDSRTGEYVSIWAKRLALPSVSLLVIAVYSFKWLHPLWEAIAIACLMAYTSQHATLWGRALDWKPLAWLGTVSYSIYVWQEPFMLMGTRALPYAVGIGLPVCVLTCHYAIERPLRRLGRRISETLRRPYAPEIHCASTT